MNKLTKLPASPHIPINEFNERRKKIAGSYNERLRDIEWIETLKVLEKAYHVYHQYTVKVKDGKRDNLQKYLFEKYRRSSRRTIELADRSVVWRERNL